MTELSIIREKLDGIDKKIVDLYQERMELCKEVAEYKIANGKMVLDRERELQKLSSLKQLANNDFNEKGINELFEQIMSMSRKLQYQILAKEDHKLRLPFQPVETLFDSDIKVVFQGAEGAYSQIAMERFFGEEIDSFHVDTFRQAMCALEEGSADYAVLPIENSTAGIVSEIYDLLVEFENYIVGEQVVEIEHCLLGVEEAELEDIRVVYSHPQSLMQSASYLGTHQWQQISLLNNAFAARKVKEEGKKEQAAIASEKAGRLYGLKILERGVNQEENNCTRFIVVSSKKIFLEKADKISLCFEIPHKSGSLYHILSHFIYNNLNMSKIESRPIPERNFEYRFFIDFDGNLKDSAVRNALRGLREETTNLKILGNY
ncbi:MAG: prephenate dehydratase [Lachnospiraceae bacterium]|nr:prephenate dehydratase [Lachnospiraceae bacterium]